MGTVNLAAPAPVHGVAVTVTSNNPAVNGGGPVEIPEGQLTGTFSVATTPVAASTNVTLTAAVGQSAATTTLTLNPPCVAATDLKLLITNGATGNGTLSGTVGLNGMAPSGGTTVNLLSGGGPIAAILVPQGKQSAAVNLNLADTTQIKDMTVTAQTGACPVLSVAVQKDAI